MDLINNAIDSVKDAAQSVVDTVQEGGLAAAMKYAEGEIKKYTGKDIEVVQGDIPSDWLDWVRKTGVNSICVDDTWDFLERGSGCDRRLELWEKRNIKKIILSVEKESDLDDYEKRWFTSIVTWNEGSTEMEIGFCPRAKTWESDNMWMEPGYKRWWCLRDSIVFGLQLYQLEGKCFYKSDWVENFEDVDPNSCLPNGTTTYKRWLQFRHWTMMWYEVAHEGWNYQYTKKPPKLPDGSDFNLDSILSLPNLPSMPSIRLPSLPDIEMPSMPTVELPSIEAPSLSAPSLSAPSLGSMPSMADRKHRPSCRWDCHGVIELTDLKVKASGSTLILSNATVHNFWEKDGYIDTEKVEHKRFELKVTSAEQAESWVASLKESGCEEGDVGGCCTIA